MASPCPVCKRPMTALFTSLACDWCDGLRQPIAADRGFVIWSGEVSPEGRELNVFPSREMAEYYQQVTHTEGKIREVISESPIRWRIGTGSIPNLRLADHLYTVFPDHRFEPGAFRAFLARRPRSRRAA